MQIAFVVETVDDGIDEPETIASDDVIIVSWALPNVNDTEELRELEAGVMQYYADASPAVPSLPTKKFIMTQTTTKVMRPNSSKIEPGAIIPPQNGAETKVVELGDLDL